jgi:Putative zinc-binding metallo-peptidase
MPTSARRGKRRSERWSGLTDAELLEWRFRDLGLKPRDSILWPDVEHLYAALERRGIGFRPHVWLSTEWFSPDGIPGIAVPFFAAHPRLAQLERRLRGEAEGANRRWRRRILRHEAGHALDTAYALRRRADWRAVFGRASKPYPSDYAARPASRRFVQHLGHWYAQSHPTEDFAETFAVWLQPKARWRRDYTDWPALEKLEYVDALMAEIAGRRPRNSNRSVIAPLADNRRTLREHYRRHRSLVDASERRYDRWLMRAFAHRSKRPRAAPASVFLAAAEPAIRQQILGRATTGSYLFTHVASTLRRRARELDLVLRGSRRAARATAVRLHERVMDDLLRRNRERYLI